MQCIIIVEFASPLQFRELYCFFRYAQPLAIIDMWQKYGVGNGAEVLEVSDYATCEYCP